MADQNENADHQTDEAPEGMFAALAQLVTAPRSAVTLDASTLAAFLRDHFVSDVFEDGNGDHVLFVATGEGNMREVRLRAVNPTLPDFIEARQTFVEPDSLVDYVQAFGTPHSIIMADINARRFVVALDYHVAGADGAHAPGRNKHTVTLETPYDDDWAAWRKVLNQPMPQLQLAEFIEDNMHTIMEPSAGDLLDMVNTIKINRSIAVAQVRNERDGTIKLQFEETDAADVLLPQQITLALPVFQGTPEIEVVAKVRYRMDRNSGAVSFLFAVPSVSRIERDEFRKIGTGLTERTGKPVLYGKTSS